MKKHILLTGIPGIGKTTLIKSVCESLQKDFKIYGFYTEEIRERGSRIGFDIITFDGERGTLARKSESIGTSINQNRVGPKVGNYIVDVQSFERLALPTISINNKVNCDIIILDEIGKMELFSHKFKAAIMKLFNDTSMTILATIPVTKSLTLVNELREREDVHLIEVSVENRNFLKENILDILKPQNP